MKIKLYFLKNIFPRKLRKTDNVFQGRKGRYLGNTVPERGRKRKAYYQSRLLVVFRKYSPREGTETLFLNALSSDFA